MQRRPWLEYKKKPNMIIWNETTVYCTLGIQGQIFHILSAVRKDEHLQMYIE